MRVHFVGIGGIGMSGIAYVLTELGYQVSGSDLHATNLTRKLEKRGVPIHLGHSAGNIKGADLLVVSSAVSPENPEVLEAKAQKIPIWQRAEMLGSLMKERFGIAVAGTHGKTTTTSMIASILENAGGDPTVVVGGEVNGFEYNGKLGKSQFLVVEADESDASCVRLSPKIAVVTNIDADVNLGAAPFALYGFDYEKTLQGVQEVFYEFLRGVSPDGFAVVCLDCPRVRHILSRPLSCRRITYGLESEADFTADGLEFREVATKFVVYHQGKKLGEVSLQIPGRHNVLNALAAIAAVRQVGVKFSDAVKALENFHGVKRRFQILGEANRILVVDDYAHNPTKVKATLAAAKSGWNRRTVVVFQPHRFTRTKFLGEEYLRAFEQADILLVTEIYSAGELPIPGIQAEVLTDQIRKANPAKPVYFVPTPEKIFEKLLETAKPEDMVLLLGAGDISQMGYQFLEILQLQAFDAGKTPANSST